MEPISNLTINSFKNLVISFVKEALCFLRTYKLEEMDIDTYFSWKSIRKNADGFPIRDLSFSAGAPRDYTNLFRKGWGRNQLVSAQDFTSFKMIHEFAKNSEEIRDRLFLKADNTGELSEYDLRDLISLALTIVDRYIHVFNTTEYSEIDVERVYSPIANGIFCEKLDMDIYIPILGIKFDTGGQKLADNIYLEEMDWKFQQARFQEYSSLSNVPPALKTAATHAFVLKNWRFSNYRRRAIYFSVIDSDFYPVDLIDKLFAALRIICDVDTGYSQLIIKPINWAISYQADLPPLLGTEISAYPIKFNNDLFTPFQRGPEIGETAIAEIGELIKKFMKEKCNSLRVALKRINLCYYRDNDEDTLIDAVIGLESLISNDSNQEMTYKLAMRIGALGRLFNIKKDSKQIYTEIKRIYHKRSEIIHGSSKTLDKREIEKKVQATVDEIGLAKEYLRLVIRTLAENPQYFNPAHIDNELLLKSKE